MISELSGSIPPVSIIVKLRSSQELSAYILSLVIPGVSFTIEIRDPAITLKSDDFPTLGRPTMATMGLLINLLFQYEIN